MRIHGTGKNLGKKGRNNQKEQRGFGGTIHGKDQLPSRRHSGTHEYEEGNAKGFGGKKRPMTLIEGPLSGQKKSVHRKNSLWWEKFRNREKRDLYQPRGSRTKNFRRTSQFLVNTRPG